MADDKCSKFRGDVERAAEYARKEANNVDGGDPDTFISAEVDGRSKFARKFRSSGDDKGNKWVIGPASLTKEYRLRLNVLSGTDIQSNTKKAAAYRAFREKMNELGWDCDIDVGVSHAY